MHIYKYVFTCVWNICCPLLKEKTYVHIYIWKEIRKGKSKQAENKISACPSVYYYNNVYLVYVKQKSQAMLSYTWLFS